MATTSDWAFFDSRLALDREGFFDRESDHVDAADFDFTMYTAWSPPPDNSWYCFARISDDTLKIENEDPLKWWRDDTLSITVDSDHSGGSIYGFTREELVNGQRYYARVLPLKHPRLPSRSGWLSRPAPRPFLRGVPVGDAQTPLRHRLDNAPARRGQRHFTRRIYLRVESGLVGCARVRAQRRASGMFSRRGRRCIWDSGCSMPTVQGSGRKHSMYILGGHQHQDRNADRMPDFHTITLDEAQNWRMPTE